MVLYQKKTDLNLKFMYGKDTINNIKEQITAGGEKIFQNTQEKKGISTILQINKKRQKEA